MSMVDRYKKSGGFIQLLQVIETCGAKFEFRKGRIIEISILIHDGLSVIDKFTTLINPECYISPNFIRISGITNEMEKMRLSFMKLQKRNIS